MPAPRRTQKQIAERYKGNLGYYNKLHPWRRARAVVSVIAIVGGVIAIIVFQTRGHETFFNAGKISVPHASIADNCTKCHDQTLMTGGRLTASKFKEVLGDRFWHGVAFEPIDKWVRMRLRSILRKRQGRRGRGRGRDHQRWPNAFFVAQGLFTLSAASAAARQPRCGNH